MTPVAIGDTQGTLQARKICKTVYNHLGTLVRVHTEETTGAGKFIISVKEDDEEPIPEVQLTWNMPDKDIAKVERQDTFCMKVIEEIQDRKRKTIDNTTCIKDCCIDTTLIISRDFKH